MPIVTTEFVSRNYYPLVSSTDTLMIVFSEHGISTARPHIIVAAVAPDTQIVVKSGPDLATNLFTLTETIDIPGLGSQIDRPLPITAGATTNVVTVITVARGKVAVTIDSPIQYRSYLQQPMINPPLN